MSDPIPTVNRQLVMARCEGSCERCGKWLVELHHRRPKGAGGSSLPDRHDPSNLAALCTTCHRWAHSRPTAAEGEGYLVPRRSGLVPASVPIAHYSGRRLLLHDDDGYIPMPEMEATP